MPDKEFTVPRNYCEVQAVCDPRRTRRSGGVGAAWGGWLFAPSPQPVGLLLCWSSVSSVEAVHGINTSQKWEFAV